MMFSFILAYGGVAFDEILLDPSLISVNKYANITILNEWLTNIYHNYFLLNISDQVICWVPFTFPIVCSVWFYQGIYIYILVGDSTVL